MSWSLSSTREHASPPSTLAMRNWRTLSKRVNRRRLKTPTKKTTSFRFFQSVAPARLKNLSALRSNTEQIVEGLSRLQGVFVVGGKKNGKDVIVRMSHRPLSHRHATVRLTADQQIEGKIKPRPRMPPTTTSSSGEVGGKGLVISRTSLGDYGRSTAAPSRSMERSCGQARYVNLRPRRHLAPQTMQHAKAFSESGAPERSQPPRRKVAKHAPERRRRRVATVALRSARLSLPDGRRARFGSGWIGARRLSLRFRAAPR